MSKKQTELTERQREFFERLHALFVEYDATLNGNDTQYYPWFSFVVGDRSFHEVRINHWDHWNKDKLIQTSVIGDEYDLPLVLNERPKT